MARLTLVLLGPPEMTLDDQPLAGLASNKVHVPERTERRPRQLPIDMSTSKW